MPQVTYSITATYDLPDANLSDSQYAVQSAAQSALEAVGQAAGATDYTVDVGEPTLSSASDATAAGPIAAESVAE